MRGQKHALMRRDHFTINVRRTFRFSYLYKNAVMRTHPRELWGERVILGDVVVPQAVRRICEEYELVVLPEDEVVRGGEPLSAEMRRNGFVIELCVTLGARCQSHDLSS